LSERAQRVTSNGDQNEMIARRVVLELDGMVGEQADRWVLVHVLTRRLQMEPMHVRGAIKRGQERGWFEVEAHKRVRLTDLGRALIGGAQRHYTQRPVERSPHRRGASQHHRRRMSHSKQRHW
jgi:DNA-binding MarR family transcriptional regulator